MRIPRAVAAAAIGLSIATAPALAAAGTAQTVTGGGWFLFAGSIPM